VTTRTNRAAWFRGADEVLTIEAPWVEVALDGVVDPRVRLDVVEDAMGRVPRATFSVGLGWSPETGEEKRLEDCAMKVSAGQRVRARLLRGGTLPGAERHDLVVFEGWVLGVEMGLDAEGERLRFEAEDLGGEMLRRRVGGQRLRTAGGTVDWASGPSLVFNPDGEPNASAETYEGGGSEAYTVFAPTSSGGAVAWTLGTAVAYLLAEHGASLGVGAPLPSEVRGLLGTVPVHDVEVEGRTLEEALQALLDPVGGRVLLRTEPGESDVGRRLELWVPETAKAVWLSHQVVGEIYVAKQTQFQALQIAMRVESAPRRYVARGDRKLYESTFDLVPGWDGTLAQGSIETFSPSSNADFDAVRDVFRKWGLNEAGE